MILIMAVLLLKILTEGDAGCPSKCNCSENWVNCVSKNLEYVPYFENLSNDPIIIDLSGNSISTISNDDFSFDKNEKVLEIYLNGSKLIMIEEKAFAELENLQELYLGDNFLNALPENFVVNNENIILLDLSSNYFDEMPKIKSASLEVLAVASSGMTKIADDTLKDLPNLRVLLLQQNNLKKINPVIFEPMSNLFFVKMAYNPWQCSCTTVKLFNYLTLKRFADITEPVQCHTRDGTFIDIYDDRGVTKAFKEQCHDVDGHVSDYDYSDSEELYEMDSLLKNIDLPEKNESKLQRNATLSKKYLPRDLEIDDVFYENWCYLILLCVAVVLSLIVGAVFGSCITYKFVSGKMRQTDSFKQLLSKSEINFV